MAEKRDRPQANALPGRNSATGTGKNHCFNGLGRGGGGKPQRN